MCDPAGEGQVGDVCVPPCEEADTVDTAAAWRARIRRGEWTRPTAGLAEGYAQANMLVLPRALADEFSQFCALNPRPCPLLEMLAPGDPRTRQMADGADVRTDLPRYVVFREGVRVADPTDVTAWWEDDLVAFLLGCSFGFEWALVAAGLPLHHVLAGRNVPMYRTNLPLAPVGPFHGEMVVSMRYFEPTQATLAARISARYPLMHGAPVHTGDASGIGIADLDTPDFGDAIPRPEGTIPVFWPCGVTSQVVGLAARPRLAICHAPGHMLVLDRQHREFEVVR